MTELFETLRVEDGRPVRGEWHLGRMARSAAELGIRFDPAGAARAIRGGPPGLWRLRATLAQDGSLAVERLRFEPDPPGFAVSVGWASETVRSTDPARRHKSRDREIYDRGARIAREAGMADLLYLNERGEVVEGAISTLLVRVGGTIWTPPLSSGALPGVLRAVWLARGWVREATLFPSDLRKAEQAWLASSLRGIRPLRLEVLGAP